MRDQVGRARAFVAANSLATDLNHDGRPDIVVLSAAGQFSYHFNRGYRCLADEGALTVDAKPGDAGDTRDFRPVRAAAGDFDGDGCPDLAVGYATGEVVCCLNAGFRGRPVVAGLRIGLPTGLPARTGGASRGVRILRCAGRSPHLRMRTPPLPVDRKP